MTTIVMMFNRLYFTIGFGPRALRTTWDTVFLFLTLLFSPIFISFQLSLPQKQILQLLDTSSFLPASSDHRKTAGSGIFFFSDVFLSIVINYQILPSFK